VTLMEDSSEKQFLEKVAEWLPGVKGYREKEARRDTDRKLREALARRIDSARESLQSIKRRFVDWGQLDKVEAGDRVGRKLQRAADGLRYASYGYAGLFDQTRIQEQELERIYDYDRALVIRVEELGTHVEAMAEAGEAGESLDKLEGLVDRLLGDIDRRKGLFDPS
jgi:hypothetical protein